MKRIILVFVLVTGVLGLAVKCCPDVLPYWNMKSFNMSLSEKVFGEAITDSTSTDTLNVNILMEPVFVAQERTESTTLFLNHAHALSCTDGGFNGIKNKITDIKITSNEDFNGVPAGDDLKLICQFNENSYSDFIQNVNSYGAMYNLVIYIVNKPSQAIQRNIRVTFTFEDGTVLEQTSQDFVWY